MAEKLLGKRLKLLLRQIFEIDQLIARPTQRTDQFIQFQMHRLRIPVLRALNEEYHNESHVASAKPENIWKMSKMDTASATA